MAKLVRKTQKIFASGSAQNQVTSFGSIKAGAVDYTKDVADIQNEAFEGGWSSAVQDDYAPYRQDRNAVDFVTTSQLAYVFQEGLPEYDAGTTYYKGSWVKGADGDSLAIYESLKDDNIGNSLDDEESWEAKSFGGGLEIGDIGFAPLGIDEAQNKRRYLNGQVISQSQFVSFTNKVKAAIQLNPSLATSEANWQAEVTNSPYGICGKFVIDDDMGTIRLPKYPDWSIREVGQATVVGNGMTLGLTNGTNNAGLSQKTDGGASYGLRADTSVYGNSLSTSQPPTTTASGTWGITTDPTKSGMIADLVNANTEDKLQGKWFIQVATGVEESVDVTREIELNNPFSLLDYKWSEYEITNASWLLSNGQFNSGATYISVYNLLLEIYNGTVTKDGVSVKLSTEAYEDTDFVINTADTTFRLPIKVKLASGNAVVGNGIALGLTDGSNSGSTYGYHNGSGQVAISTQFGVNVGTSLNADLTSVSKKAVGITTDPLKSGIETSSQGLYLYFYVGETTKDANLISASGVFTALANKVGFEDKTTVIGWGMPDYSAGVKASFSSSYTAPTDGYVHIQQDNTYNAVFRVFVNGSEVWYDENSNSYYERSCFIPVSKNDVITASGADFYTFFPCKGVH